MTKKLFAVLFVTVLCINNCIFTSAYTFPHALWKINDAYLKAVEEEDAASIIQYGEQAIELISKEPESEQDVISFLADRMQTLAETYALLAQYHQSAEMYERFLPYGEKMGWGDSILIANAKIPQYKTTVDLYTDGGISPDYAAKNEPANGVLFGLPGDSDTRALLPDESATLLYHGLGETMPAYVENCLKDAAERGLSVELAVNCPGEGSDIAGFESKKSDIENISRLLKKYSDVPVFLRFGAEFNLWEVPADPEQFKEVFRYVSDYFKRNNPNVAMVWSPGATSAWGTDMNAYYPGDDYVDWVGVSLYLMKYFLANPASPDYAEAYFKTGDNADPVLCMRKIVEQYGDRKPIMIAESGQGAFVKSSYVTEDTTDWALQKMKEQYYYLPMVFPQIKFMAHFDRYMPNEATDYSLMKNPRLQAQYLDLVKLPRLIKNGSHNASMCYQVLYDNFPVYSILPVSCYAHIYRDPVSAVTYFVDDAYKASASEMPFTAYLDFSGVPAGIHTLKAVVATASGKTYEKTYPLNVSAKEDITVTVNSRKVEFDQPPTLHGGRTLVPLRAIFEALGAEVDWDPATQTVIGKKGKDTVTFQIGSDLLQKNGTTVYLDVPAMLVGGRTLVPVRAIAESLACEVDWDAVSRTVIITS